MKTIQDFVTNLQNLYPHTVDDDSLDGLVDTLVYRIKEKDGEAAATTFALVFSTLYRLNNKHYLNTVCDIVYAYQDYIPEYENSPPSYTF
jgi:hypothetical protein